MGVDKVETKSKVDITQYEDVEDDDNYSAPYVVAYDAESGAAEGEK